MKFVFSIHWKEVNFGSRVLGLVKQYVLDFRVQTQVCFTLVAFQFLSEPALRALEGHKLYNFFLSSPFLEKSFQDLLTASIDF